MRQGSTKLRVNDKVEVIAGKDKGRVGKVLKIDREKNHVFVERINMIKKHQKPKDARSRDRLFECHDRLSGVHRDRAYRHKGAGGRHQDPNVQRLQGDNRNLKKVGPDRLRSL